MKTFKKILFPVDLSETSQKIVPYVLIMAERFQAEIHLLFVARVFEYFTSIYVPHPSVDKFEAEITEGATRRLKEFKEEFFSAVKDVKTTVVSGYCSEEIIKYAQKEKIDLIIIGTHGRRGIDKVVFGSVAERVLQNSPVPVLLVNPFRISDKE